MSDNVVLSKHFDSLASAIQRCLSAGYAPTAYIPAGHESVIDNVASTVDGGIWYEVEGDIPTLKMHYGDYDFVVNLSIPREATFIFDLRADVTHGSYYDTRGNIWQIEKGTYSNIGYNGGSPLTSTNPDTITDFFLDAANCYLEREGVVTLGGKDFTVRFWEEKPATGSTRLNFLHFYNLSDKKVITVFEDYEFDTTAQAQTSVYKITFAGVTYTFPAVHPTQDEATGLNHVEIDYSHSTNALKLFYNGKLVSTLEANLSATTTARQIVGRPADDTGGGYGITEVQLYNGLALHSADFTPDYTPFSES